jgi:LAO/AO transport system kinase
VLTVSSIPPAAGIEQTADALEAHRHGLDVRERRLRSRRTSALREFATEYGERALRSIGGRREAERIVAAQDEAADVGSLVRVLEREAAA